MVMAAEDLVARANEIAEKAAAHDFDPEGCQHCHQIVAARKADERRSIRRIDKKLEKRRSEPAAEISKEALVIDRRRQGERLDRNGEWR